MRKGLSPNRVARLHSRARSNPGLFAKQAPKRSHPGPLMAKAGRWVLGTSTETPLTPFSSDIHAEQLPVDLFVAQHAVSVHILGDSRTPTPCAEWPAEEKGC